MSIAEEQEQTTLPRLVLMPPRELKANPQNWRKHPPAQRASIRQSLDEFGWLKPVTLNDTTGHLIDGHARIEEAIKQQAELVPVWVVELDPAQERRAILTLDPITQMAGVDTDALSALLAETVATEGHDGLLGVWERSAVDALLTDYLDSREPEPPDGDEEGDSSRRKVPPPRIDHPEDEAVPTPEEVVHRVKPGEVWALGRHRVMCADCTDTDAVTRLYAGTKVDIILTDPPYCSGGFQERDRSAGASKKLKGANVARDNLTTQGLEALIEKGIGRLPGVGCCYVFCDWRQVWAIRSSVEPLGYQYRALIVWDKQTPGMGGPWRHQHELVYFGTRRKEPATGQFGDVLRVPRTGNEWHTTEKPVALLRTLLANTKGEIVADPFAGSGSTLMAAEREGRTCYATEVEPAYCDVILQRWEQATGEVAELLDGGRNTDR